MAATGALAWMLVVAGTGVAEAATRARSGAFHAQLLDSTTRLAQNGAAPPGLHLIGLDVMAASVALMAVLAMMFMVVTFIRRRTRLA